MTNKKSLPLFLQVILLTVMAITACGGEEPEDTPMAPTVAPDTLTPSKTAGVTATRASDDGTRTAGTPESGLTRSPEATAIDGTAKATPDDSSPTAVIVSGESAGAGKPFTFDATQSQVGEASIVAYEWDMGDGAFLFGVSVEHAYSEPGFFTVSLTVIDANGGSDKTSIEVEVFDLDVETTPTVEGESALVGTKWEMKNAIRGTKVTLDFSTDMISGSAGCNTYSGRYTIVEADATSAEISVSSISSTSDTCTLEIMAQEQGYLDSLGSARGVTIEGTTLIMETASGTLMFDQVTE